MTRRGQAVGATGTITGAIAVAVGEVFEASSPRGPRRVQVEGVEHGDVSPLAHARELHAPAPACTHLLAVLGDGPCRLCPPAPPREPLFTIALTWRDAAWRMPTWYRPAPAPAT